MSGDLAVLTCSACDGETEHELRYVGRLCQSTRCTACGHVVRHEQGDLYAAYLRDLEHRVATKPLRLLRQAASTPVAFLSGLPAAVLRQPAKLGRELWTLLRP
ncbi:MAG TPA: hypothetical protein VFR07_06620 [Mycobacteriales bacterium]|jgi:hypothetical protein|nr:hypothetical protein [Mycobacteriales bacterium]